MILQVCNYITNIYYYSIACDIYVISSDIDMILMHTKQSGLRFQILYNIAGALIDN